MDRPLFFGPYGSSALAYIENFIPYGANAAWFHGFDPQAFDTCQKNNIEPCVEFKTFRVDFDTRPDLVPIGVNGHPIRYGDLVQGVCLSRNDFLEEIEETLRSGLSMYQPTGIWLDYLTYAGWFETPDPDLQESCFCQDCIADFCNTTGIDSDQPYHILTHYQEQWTAHKCERVARLAANYAGLIRQSLPTCFVGAYTCPWRPDEFDGALGRIFAQDYELLAPAIDIFTPLIYVVKSGRTPDWGREFLESAVEFIPEERQVQLILDAMDFPESLLETAISNQPSYGLQMFNGAQIFNDPDKAAIFRDAVETIRQIVA